MLEEQIIREIKNRSQKITTAESCTGGMIAAQLINVAGASEVYNEGFITYSNSSKQKLLGVTQTVLNAYGAVSHQVAAQMAIGAAQAANADIALAATGIAGPDGGTIAKPVGLVFIGCYIAGRTVVTENHFQGNRLSVREQTVQAALKLLLSQLRK